MTEEESRGTEWLYTLCFVLYQDLAKTMHLKVSELSIVSVAPGGR